jgi:glycine/D-amino acid oxidase-like deaminating enzyme
MNQDNNNSINVDAVVIGTGILGLLLAKRLLDLGQTVAIVEKGATIAHGASSKNHGWIHQGTTHALSADSAEQGRETARHLQYGHTFFKSYAPECFDEPFLKSYAITNDIDRAAFARERWAQCGVPFEELTAEEFAEIEPNVRKGAASFFFRVADARLNNRMLFMKLFTEIKKNGAVILTEATYEHTGSNRIQVTTPRGTTNIAATTFLYATGAGIEDSYRKLTGEPLLTRYFKCHMIFLPRFTNVSVIGLDQNSPIVVNHGDIAAVNRAHDEVQTVSGDYRVDPAEIRRSLQTLAELYPAAESISRENMHTVACLKPYIPVDASIRGLRIDATVLEPREGHIFALPGKMTAAPYVADEIIKNIFPRLSLHLVTPRPFDVPKPSVLTPIQMRSLTKKTQPKTSQEKLLQLS